MLLEVGDKIIRYPFTGIPTVHEISRVTKIFAFISHNSKSNGEPIETKLSREYNENNGYINVPGPFSYHQSTYKKIMSEEQEKDARKQESIARLRAKAYDRLNVSLHLISKYKGEEEPLLSLLLALESFMESAKTP